MIRYKSQRKRSLFCGPIVLLNAMKFVGEKAAWNKNKKQLKTLCKYEDRSGTNYNNLYSAFYKKSSSSFKRGRMVKKPNLNYLDKALNKKQAVVIKFYHGSYDKRFGHFALVIDKTEEMGYTVINMYSGETTSYVSRKDMSTCLKLTAPNRGSGYKHSRAWTIRNKREL